MQKKDSYVKAAIFVVVGWVRRLATFLIGFRRRTGCIVLLAVLAGLPEKMVFCQFVTNT